MNRTSEIKLRGKIRWSMILETFQNSRELAQSSKRVTPTATAQTRMNGTDAYIRHWHDWVLANKRYVSCDLVFDWSGHGSVIWLYLGFLVMHGQCVKKHYCVMVLSPAQLNRIKTFHSLVFLCHCFAWVVDCMVIRIVWKNLHISFNYYGSR